MDFSSRLPRTGFVQLLISKLAESLAWDRLGLRVETARSGLAINSVRRGSPAARVGLVSGDVVLKVNNQRTNTVDSFLIRPNLSRPRAPAATPAQTNPPRAPRASARAHISLEDTRGTT